MEADWREVPAQIARTVIYQLNHGYEPTTLEECQYVAARLGQGYRIKVYPDGYGIEPSTNLDRRKIFVPRCETEAALVAILLHELYEIATYEDVAAPYHFVGPETEHHRVACLAQTLPKKSLYRLICQIGQRCGQEVLYDSETARLVYLNRLIALMQSATGGHIVLEHVTEVKTETILKTQIAAPRQIPG